MARAKITGVQFYNPEIKEKFLSEQKDTMKSNLIILFRNTKSFEEQKKKDLYEFSFQEIEEYYRYLNKTSVKGIMMVHNNVRRYIRWAYSKGLINYYEVRLEDIMEGNIGQYCNQVMMKAVVIDRETIVDWTERLRKDYDYYNPRDSFLVLAPYEGIAGYMLNELTSIQRTDIIKDGDKFYAKLPNRTIPISKELYKIAQEAIEEELYYANRREGSLKAYTLEKNNNIVRLIQGRNSKHFGYNNIVKQVKQALVMVDAGHITVKHIITSGKIHMIRQKAKEHGLSERDYMRSQFFKDEVCYQFHMDSENATNHFNSFKILMGL